MRLVFTLLLVCFISVVHSQEKIFQFEIKDISQRTSKEGLNIGNELNGDIAVFIFDRRKFYGHLFDESLTEVSRIQADRVKSKYENLIGFKVNSRNYHLVHANKAKNKFAIQTIDFDTNKNSVSELNFDAKDQIFLESAEYKNRFLFFTANDNEDFFIWELNDQLKLELLKKFSSERLDINTSLSKDLYRIGFWALAGKSQSNVSVIDTKTPIALEQTAVQNKMYQINDEIILTFEKENKGTVVYSIDLGDLSMTSQLFPYPKGRSSELKKFNSLFIDDKIFQIGSSKDEMLLTITSIDSVKLKEFHIEKDNNITFKNSPIYQEGPTSLPFVENREFEATSKFLRKVNNGNPGISVTKIGDQYDIILGGCDLTRTNPYVIASGVHETPSVTSITFHHSLTSYLEFYRSKSIYFKTVLDHQLMYSSSPSKQNVFDRIKEFQSQQSYATAEDIFFYNGDLYYSYFNQKESQYNLFKI